MRVCKWFPVCPVNFYNKRGVVPDSYISEFCKGDNEKCIRYQKEEAGIYHPDNMLPDGTIIESE